MYKTISVLKLNERIESALSQSLVSAKLYFKGKKVFFFCFFLERCLILF